MITAAFTVDSDLLVEATEQSLETVVEIETKYRHSSGGIYVLFWASNGDLDAFEDGLHADPTITDAERLLTDGDYRMYRAIEAATGPIHRTWDKHIEVNSVLVEATLSDRVWSVEMKFPTRESLQALWTWYDEVGIPTQLKSVRQVTAGHTTSTTLSPQQRQALVLARDRGYFDVPRQATLEEMATELGISDQALSERIRRGSKVLLDDI
ncbi:MAG: helix-turn-helix domain-containing protein [Halobacteriota archaeon]